MNERDRRRRTSGLRRDGRDLLVKQASQARANPRDGAGYHDADTVDPSEAARFWAKVTTGSACGPPGCWLWAAGTTRNGYGRFRVRREGRWTHVMAHRWAYEQAHGPIPAGIYPDHTCHTNDPDCPGGPDCPHRRCVNPAHLEAVNDEENRRRARDRERTPTTREAI